MHKIFVVAMREYIAAVKTKAFVISIVVIPLFYVVGFSLPMLLKDRVDVSDKVVKVVDPTGEIAPLLKQQADTRNSEQIFAQDDAERQVKPKFLIEPVDLNGSSLDDEMMLTLSDEVRDGKLLAFMVIAPDILSRESGDGAVRYYSNRPTYDDFVNWARGPMTRYVQSQRLAKAELDPKVVAAATRPVPLRSLGLLNRSVDGSIEKAKETNRFANFIIPFAVLMLMFMTVMVGASPLMQTVLEEKMQRIAEVLLASVTPFQLMLGKLIGIVGVSVTLSTLYLAGTYFAVRQAGFADHLPSDVVIWFVVFQILSVLMFGSGFAAVGAAVTDLKEAQSLITPLMMIPVLPMFFLQLVVSEPSSALSTTLSFIPPMTPSIMMVRLVVPPGIPVWQPVVGALLVGGSALLCVWAAGRVFRVGILMQGKGASVQQIVGWVLGRH